MKRFWISIVRLFGWKFDLPPEEDWKRLHHCVLIEVPHTSIYDFLLGAACVWRLGLNGKFFIKKEFFVFPLRRFMRWSGAVAIDRGNRGNHMVEQAVEALKNNEELTIIITPEGTRKSVKRFKRGFYEIATQAQVPIALTYINYRTRHMGVGPLFEPTGNFENDMREILKFYAEAGPRDKKGWNYAGLTTTYGEKR